jgi:uncharacterized protein (DUF2235 family)
VKRIVICCDGTWNKPDQYQGSVLSPSNVTKVALCVAPVDAKGDEQRVFYDKGVGTGAFDRLRGGAFGFGISTKILDSYGFLIANYDPGDELFFFGFSRGAYTVRSTFGLIRNSGLLKREYADKVDDAFRLYRRRDDASRPNQIEVTLFRKSFSYEPRAKFVGVWDTVGALGIPIDGLLRFLDKFLNKYLNKGWQFHDVQLSRLVDYAYQALAIDEKRKPFQPAIWEQQAGSGAQVLEQIWFAGVHSKRGWRLSQRGSLGHCVRVDSEQGRSLRAGLGSHSTSIFPEARPARRAAELADPLLQAFWWGLHSTHREGNKFQRVCGQHRAGPSERSTEQLLATEPPRIHCGRRQGDAGSVAARHLS